jgi:hypothetical protein
VNTPFKKMLRRASNSQKNLQSSKASLTFKHLSKKKNKENNQQHNTVLTPRVKNSPADLKG